MKNFLDVSTKGHVFQFNGLLYKQINGVANGDPSRVFGNKVLCYH